MCLEHSCEKVVIVPLEPRFLLMPNMIRGLLTNNHKGYVLYHSNDVMEVH